MFFGSQIGLKDLAGLCRRLAIALQAGLDIRNVWQREADGRGPSQLRKVLTEVAVDLKAGRSLADALAEHQTFFPRVFLELVRVGEETGKLPEVLKGLAEHYESQVSLRRSFITVISWPVFQLCVSIGIIGVLILVMDYLPKMEGGKPFDILGWGLFGTRGLVIYLMWVATLAFGLYLCIEAMRKGLAWTRPMQGLLMKLPGLGKALDTLALARMAQAMHLTMDTGMSVMRALPLSLRATERLRYTEHSDELLRQIKAGSEIHEALAATRKFPPEFLDTIEVGEQSGRLPESMEILARQYHERAQLAFQVLGRLAGFGVWAAIATIIIFVIIKMVFITILNPINEALEMVK